MSGMLLVFLHDFERTASVGLNYFVNGPRDEQNVSKFHLTFCILGRRKEGVLGS